MSETLTQIDSPMFDASALFSAVSSVMDALPRGAHLADLPRESPGALVFTSVSGFRLVMQYDVQTDMMIGKVSALMIGKRKKMRCRSRG